MFQKIALATILLSLLSNYCTCQTYVLDEDGRLPIAEVRAAFGQNEVVLYTGSSGMLDTITSKCFSLFHPAYYTKIACHTDTVFLTKKTMLIPEATITDKIICEWAVPKGKKFRGGFGIGPGDMQGVAVGGKNFQGQRIGHVRFKLSEKLADDLRVRFHLANLADTGKPMIHPIISTVESFQVSRKKGWVDFDLSDEYLVLPDFQVALMIEFISDQTGVIVYVGAFEDPEYDTYYLRPGLVFRSWRSWMKEYSKLYLEHTTPYFAPAIMVEVCN